MVPYDLSVFKNILYPLLASPPLPPICLHSSWPPLWLHHHHLSVIHIYVYFFCAIIWHVSFEAYSLFITYSFVSLPPPPPLSSSSSSSSHGLHPPAPLPSLLHHSHLLSAAVCNLFAYVLQWFEHYNFYWIHHLCKHNTSGLWWRVRSGIYLSVSASASRSLSVKREGWEASLDLHGCDWQ